MCNGNGTPGGIRPFATLKPFQGKGGEYQTLIFPFESLHRVLPNKKSTVKVDYLFGTPGGIRTPDPLFRRQMLYPAELPVRILVVKLALHM